MSDDGVNKAAHECGKLQFYSNLYYEWLTLLFIYTLMSNESSLIRKDQTMISVTFFFPHVFLDCVCCKGPYLNYLSAREPDYVLDLSIILPDYALSETLA